jgi:hypothetical protein
MKEIAAAGVQPLEDTRGEEERDNVFFHFASIVKKTDAGVMIKNNRHKIGPHRHGFGRDETQYFSMLGDGSKDFAM